MNWVWQRETTEPYSAAGYTITLEAELVGLRWPGGAWVWKRPRRVYVSRQDVTQVYPIVDVTRWGQITLILLGLLLSAGVRQRRERNA